MWLKELSSSWYTGLNYPRDSKDLQDRETGSHKWRLSIHFLNNVKETGILKEQSNDCDILLMTPAYTVSVGVSSTLAVYQNRLGRITLQLTPVPQTAQKTWMMSSFLCNCRTSPPPQRNTHVADQHVITNPKKKNHRLNLKFYLKSLSAYCDYQ